LNGVVGGGVALGNVTVSTLTGSGAALENESAKTFSLDDGSGNGPVSVTMTSFSGADAMQNVVDQINSDLSAAGSTIAASISGGQIQLLSGRPDRAQETRGRQGQARA
jgi:hypothetical protein